MNRPAIFLITGLMAAGKSTVAQALAERFPHSVHLRGDLFRRLIVNGRAEMGVELSTAALAQLQLRYAIATSVAQHYLAGGFAVVYQDIILGETLSTVVDQLRQASTEQAAPLYVVVLCPSPEVVARREASRPKTGYAKPAEITTFDQVLRTATPRIGLWLDSSQLTVSQTIDLIIANLAAARIG